jgi:hypothetical protein
MSDFNYKHTRLEELGQQAISLIEAEYDLRDYTVLDAHKNPIGRVVELLFDIQSKKLRYLIVELHTEDVDNNLRQILAPIGTAEPHEEENYIVIPALNKSLINALPDYEKGSVNPGVENMVRLAYAGEDLLAEGSGLTGNDILNEEDDFYSHLHFDLEKLFRKKKVAPTYVQSVRGVFDDSLEAENSVSDLIKEGFNQDAIQVSSTKTAESGSGIDESINGGGTLVCVKIKDQQEAFKVTEIMNINGCISVYESSDKEPC